MENKHFYWLKALRQKYTYRELIIGLKDIIRHEKLSNKCIGLFIVAIINKLVKLNFRWWNKGATLTRLCSLKIKLPVDKDGNPDWEYMEKYIKSVINKIN